MQMHTWFLTKNFVHDYRSARFFKWFSTSVKLVTCIIVYAIDFFVFNNVPSYRGKDSQGEEVIRPYTPTTLDSDIGYFDLVIKV